MYHSSRGFIKTKPCLPVIQMNFHKHKMVFEWFSFLKVHISPPNKRFSVVFTLFEQFILYNSLCTVKKKLKYSRYKDCCCHSMHSCEACLRSSVDPLAPISYTFHAFHICLSLLGLILSELFACFQLDSLNFFGCLFIISILP